MKSIIVDPNAIAITEAAEWSKPDVSIDCTTMRIAEDASQHLPAPSVKLLETIVKRTFGLCTIGLIAGSTYAVLYRDLALVHAFISLTSALLGGLFGWTLRRTTERG